MVTEKVTEMCERARRTIQRVRRAPWLANQTLELGGLGSNPWSIIWRLSNPGQLLKLATFLCKMGIHCISLLESEN